MPQSTEDYDDAVEYIHKMLPYLKAWREVLPIDKVPWELHMLIQDVEILYGTGAIDPLGVFNDHD